TPTGSQPTESVGLYKDVRMMLYMSWTWDKKLKKRNSWEFQRRQAEIKNIVEKAMQPVIVRYVKIRKFYPSVYADTLVVFDRASYNTNHMTYNRVKRKLYVYADSDENKGVLRSISSVTSNGQVPTVLGVTLMCIVFEVLWQLL
ncbi:unnamed protein product, partial [Calicophoron daubneyi]